MTLSRKADPTPLEIKQEPVSDNSEDHEVVAEQVKQESWKISHTLDVNSNTVIDIGSPYTHPGIKSEQLDLKPSSKDGVSCLQNSSPPKFILDTSRGIQFMLGDYPVTSGLQNGLLMNLGSLQSGSNPPSAEVARI